MGNKVPGYWVLTGTYAEIWVDGELIAEAKKGRAQGDLQPRGRPAGT